MGSLEAPAPGGALRLDDENLLGYVEQSGILPGADRVESMGEGNLNYVRRVRAADGATVVVKQARTGIEGLPDFPLSSARILFERRYEQVVRSLLPESADVLPRILRFDEDARILVMEDVGNGRSLLEELRAGRDRGSAVRRLAGFLGEVHAASLAHTDALQPQFANDEMRRLRGEQVFAVARVRPSITGPLADVLVDELAAPVVHRRIAELRRDYYQRSDALVHGDVKCANVLLQGGEPRLIDAEFAHVGDPAFDLGSGLAHLLLCMVDDAGDEAREAAEATWLEGYAERASGSGLGDCGEIVRRARRYAGVDMIYHVLGPVRLPFFEAEEVAAGAVRRGIELLCSSG